MRYIRLLFLTIICASTVICQRVVNWNAPPIEKEHDPTRYTTTISPFLKGTDYRIPYDYQTPDFRVEEPFWLPLRPYVYGELHRPYRISPHYKATYYWSSYKRWEYIPYLGCYCTTVYKRLTPLAGCALITTRHILTTATSTHLILKDKYDFLTLENILGAWYDTNLNNYNSSMYFTPARIHYHPLWHYPENVNRSHPFSFTFDLAVWASTHNVYGWYMNSGSSYICLRASSHVKEHSPPTPPSIESFIIIGFQFMWAYQRKPTPFHKYAVQTNSTVAPCPKTDWGWFLCISGKWAKYGIESGAALHRTFKGMAWRYDGLIGINAFSMQLRSMEIVHYFTILDNHLVLEFLWDAYESNLQYVWLDARFNDTKHAAPKIRENYYLDRSYPMGEESLFEPYMD